MFTVPFYDKQGYGHTGGIDGFNASAFHFMDEDLSVSYTSNGMKSPINNLMIGVLSIYFGMDYQLPEFSETIVMKTADLEKYNGVYSSEGFPMKLTITAENDQLKAQGTGQPSFILEPLGDHKFQYESAGLVVTFNPEKSTLVFEQMGATYELTRE